MRSLGMAERALELMCARASARIAFGGPIAEQGVVAQYIAESRMAIDQARLLTLRAAWRIDKHGTRAARDDVAAIKVVVPRVALDVLDRAIQVHGAAGVSDDVPLAAMVGRSSHAAHRRRPGRGAHPLGGPRGTASLPDSRCW